ncbi:MAG: hypothetical protein ACK55X_13185 [Synechococcaceae cyanobacterium]|jgi:hypothetical protein
MTRRPVRQSRPRSLRLRGSLSRLASTLLLASSLLAFQAAPAQAASALLETVKQNPALARKLCERFKQYNAQGKSATSREAISWVAADQDLSPVDAEVLSTYVIGLHCPDVR